MDLPKIVSREEWLVSRKKLLKKEKEFTRQRDELNAERRSLPMVKIEKEYSFEGPDGKAGLTDLFENRRQLIVYHFMFDPDWEEGCASCSFVVDNIGNLSHLLARNTTLALVSRAPLAKIEKYKTRMGWNLPWYSSYEDDFNHDFKVTMGKIKDKGGVQLPGCNRTCKEPERENDGTSGNKCIYSGCRLCIPYLFFICTRAGYSFGNVSLSRSYTAWPAGRLGRTIRAEQ
ncbi:MAG: DUF899 family protein [Balneolaceae bacterium]